MLDILESFLRIMSAAKTEIQRLEYQVAELKCLVDGKDRVCTDETQVFDRNELARTAKAYKLAKTQENK